MRSGDIFAGRYRILKGIGRDGTGQLYRAEDTVLGIIVALKVIHPRFGTRPLLADRLKKEILRSREITHENVVRIYDFGDRDGIKFISMELVEGERLSEVLRRSAPLNIKRSVKIFQQVCSGLAAAHRRGILHLNLQPAAIMVGVSDSVWIADFGLSGRETAAPAYLPPEWQAGVSGDAAADIYALGVLLAEMVTGRPPAPDSSPAELRKQLVKVTPFLKQIILTCLRRNPRRRFREVTDILTILERQRVKTGVISRPVRRRRIAACSVSFGLIALFAMGIYIYKRYIVQRLPDPIDSNTYSVGVLYFSNLTGDRSLDKWEAILPNLLSTDLGQSKYLRVVPEIEWRQILRDIGSPPEGGHSPRVLAEIAGLSKVDFLLMGRIVPEGDTVQLKVDIVDTATQLVLYTEAEVGRTETDFLAVIDRLTPEIKKKIKLSGQEIRSDFDREIMKITTASPRAMASYWQGMAYYVEGKYEQSIEEMKEAVAVDPDFALALYRIAVNYSYIGYCREGREFLRRALKLQDRVSRREYFLIKGFEVSYLNNDLSGAVKIYREMVRLFPDDEQGYVSLGAMYRNLEEWGAAIKVFKRLLRMNPRKRFAYENLINIYMKTGRYDQALKTVEAGEERLGKRPFTTELRSRIYMCQRKFDLAAREAKAAWSMDPDHYLFALNLGNILQAGGDLPAAEKIYRELTGNGAVLPILKGYYWLACLYLEQGNVDCCQCCILSGLECARHIESKVWEIKFELLLNRLYLYTDRPDEALAAVLRAVRLVEDHDYLFLKRLCLSYLGLTHLQSGHISEAKLVLSRIEALPASFFGKIHTRDVFLLRGLIALKGKKYKKAVQWIERALSRLPGEAGNLDEHAFYAYALASVYYDSGQADDCIEVLRKLTSLTFGRLRFGALHVNGYYWLAKCYQSKEWNGIAIDNYRIFIERWKDAAIGRQRLADAKRQLALLENKSL